MYPLGVSRICYVAPAELNFPSPVSDTQVLESQALCHAICLLSFFLSEEKYRC